MTSQRMPPQVLEFIRFSGTIATMLEVPRANNVNQDGLYLGLRARRDPINTNRKRRYITVRLRRGGVEVFRSEEETKGFPSDHLITQLMLVK